MEWIFGLLAFIGVLMTFIGYSSKSDYDDEASTNLFLAGLALALFGMFCVGISIGEQIDKKVKHQVKPSIEITIKDNKADTTYIYTFEEK